MGIPAKFMRAYCKYCGRPLVYANIPNRGPVMAHRRGERARCDILQAQGRDLVSINARKAIK